MGLAMKYNVKLLYCIMLVLGVICAIIHFILPEMLTLQSVFHFIVLSIVIIFIGSFIHDILPILAFEVKRLWRKNRYIFCYFILIILSAVYPICILSSNDNDINNGDTLSFYGAFITFLGTFSLGYFTYIRDINYQNEIKVQNIKSLLDMLCKSDDDLANVSDEKIVYDQNWQTYFYSFESYTGINDYSLKDVIKKHVQLIDKVNSISNVEKKKKIIHNYFLKDKYSTRSYNYVDLKKLLVDYSHNHGFYLFSHKPWNKNNKIDKMITDYAGKYYDVIENWIYSYMLKNHLTQTKYANLELELLDWISKGVTIDNSVDVDIKDRFIAEFTYRATTLLNKNSEKLNLTYGTIYFNE